MNNVVTCYISEGDIMINDDDLYMRQHELDLKVPEKVAVIGVGGVGSWVVKFCAIAGVKNMIIIDPDYLEVHNLNRTPYAFTYVDDYKVSAAEEMVYRIRPNIEIEAFPMRTDELPDVIIEKLKDYIILDCRDEISPLKNFNQPPVSGGYDGRKITISVNPKLGDIISEEQVVRYRITPSYLVPPVLIAITMVNHLCNGNWTNDPNTETIMNIDVTRFNDILKMGTNGITYDYS